MTAARDPGSFRDPNGFVFRRDGRLFRQIQRSGRDDYERLMGSGLHRELVQRGMLVDHREVDVAPCEDGAAHKVIEPEAIPFVSYPYEWPYGALWAAARLTLGIQRLALAFGMSLKDATAYNVQFRGTRPVWIDTLSFERRCEERPWVAYRQFCEHFLAPLALQRRRGLGLGTLSRTHLEGVPLPLASRLLPLRTRLRPGLLLHVHLHARSMERHAARAATGPATGRFGSAAMGGLLDSLDATLAGLAPAPASSHWTGYYGETSYSEHADRAKQRIVEELVARVDPETVWDLGSNTGRYARLAARAGRRVVAMDADPAAVERLFQACAAAGDGDVLPLVMDLANPSPDLGWACRERASLLRRGPADLGLALALVHHLAIGHNVPLEQVAGFLARACRALVIEFVPKEDPQVRRMLAVREDVFPRYDRAGFEKAFARGFVVEEVRPIPDSPRTLYLLSARSA
jgi:ribosomal protein L11 methylase PrmA